MLDSNSQPQEFIPQELRVLQTEPAKQPNNSLF